jgi:hypothetical protein
MMLDRIFLFLISAFLKDRTRVIYTNGEKYLLRVYIKQPGKYLPGIFLHRFYSSDKDEHLHNHPWKKAWSLILTGKYLEERLSHKKSNTNKVVELSLYGPLRVNYIDDEIFHRIRLIHPEDKKPVWTLFFSKERHQTWGFWDSRRSKFIPWNEYVSSHGNYVTDYYGNVVRLVGEE